MLSIPFTTLFPPPFFFIEFFKNLFKGEVLNAGWEVGAGGNLPEDGSCFVYPQTIYFEFLNSSSQGTIEKTPGGKGVLVYAYRVALFGDIINP